MDIPVLSLVTILPELTRVHLNLMNMREWFFHYIKHLCFAWISWTSNKPWHIVHVSICCSIYPPVWTECIAGLVTGKLCNNSFPHHGWGLWHAHTRDSAANSSMSFFWGGGPRNVIGWIHHHNIFVMELGHLLTHSSLTYPEVSSKVCHNSFCQMENSVSLPWVIYYEAFYLHFISSFSCTPVICPKLVLFLIPL